MRIVISYDGSDGARAALEDLTRAGLGKTVEATVVSVAEVWVPPAETSDESFPGEKLPEVQHARQVADAAIANMQSVADEAKSRLQSTFPAWNVTTEVLAGSPWWEVIEKANELNADLIVVGSHGRSALGRLFLGSISQKILNEAHCSVRVGRKGPDASSSARVLLVAVDGSRGGEAAILEVARREWPSDIRIHVISAEDPSVPLAFGGVNQDIEKWVGESGEGQRGWVQKMVEASAEHLRQAGFDASAEVKQGDPKKVLVAEAERLGADCIFVGASGLTNRLEQFLLGSVSTTVANRAECAVEVVRPRG